MGLVEIYSWEFLGGIFVIFMEVNLFVFYENVGVYMVLLKVNGLLGEFEIVKEGVVEVLLRFNFNFDFMIDGFSVSF